MLKPHQCPKYKINTEHGKAEQQIVNRVAARADDFGEYRNCANLTNNGKQVERRYQRRFVYMLHLVE